MSNKLIVVDVEADGPAPGIYSMVCFGAVVVEKTVNPGKFKTFYGECAPLPGSQFNPDALKVSGITREQHVTFRKPEVTMPEFYNWVSGNCGIHRPVFISDNPAFDWQFINYYFHKYCNNNPFGFSARRIGDIYCGLVGHLGKNSDWKKMRKTRHDHNPVNDAIGNAEALLQIFDQFPIDLGGVIL